MMECMVHLPNIVKVKQDIYWRTDERGKIRCLIADGGSNICKQSKLKHKTRTHLSKRKENDFYTEIRASIEREEKCVHQWAQKKFIKEEYLFKHRKKKRIWERGILF